jgi:hypothetical protein
VTKQQSPGRVRKFRAFLTKLNNYYLAEGRHFMHQITERDKLTINDIALFPFVEILHAIRDHPTMAREVLYDLDLANVWKWFDRLNATEWV